MGAVVRGGNAGADVVRGGNAAGDANRIADDALVVRGGIATPEQLADGTGPHRTLPIVGFSVQSRADASVKELASTGAVGNGPIPNGKVSVTTAGELRSLGCGVLCTPGAGANHATVVPNRASFEDISNKFKVILNPAKDPK